jgi:23S rRNA (uridine2552-2'-O)-methyltransferase
LTDRRSASSKRWLERQLRDPYVRWARQMGYRSRAAFKLMELDDRFHLFRPGLRVLDLGAAPGGWTQVAVERVKAGGGNGGRVVAVDLAEMAPVDGAAFVVADVEAEDLAAQLGERLGGAADIVLSDMAPAASGHTGADHLRIIALAEAALACADAVLAPGGTFVCKLWQGGESTAFVAGLKRRFAHVRYAKPPASRADSAEIYVVASDRLPPRPKR